MLLLLLFFHFLQKKSFQNFHIHAPINTHTYTYNHNHSTGWIQLVADDEHDDEKDDYDDDVGW